MIFLTTPSRIWFSLRFWTSSERASARVSSKTARRETTILPRRRSIFRIWNGCEMPIRGPTSRTGRISTWLPGKNATAPDKSTVKPPLTRPNSTPLTRSLAAKAFSSWFQASSRRAFSRLKTASPMAFSTRSRKTSTMSPTLTSAGRPATENSLSGTRPSIFKPTSIKTKSFSTATMVPLTTVPSMAPFSARLSSSKAANSSRLIDGSAVKDWLIESPKGQRLAGRNSRRTWDQKHG